MSHKFGAKFYTIRNAKTHWQSQDGTLFANGYTPTKIKPEDLPSSFVKIYRTDLWHYLQTAGVKYIQYKPNYFTTDSLFKDDFLFLSYDKPIVKVDDSRLGWYDGYDYVCYGWDVITVLNGVLTNSEIEAPEILRELRKKIWWYFKKNSDKKEDIVDWLKTYENLWQKLKLFGSLSTLPTEQSSIS